MNRQYIGARYVTKIYENSQDPSSAEWEANVSFEPLTLVTYLYNTYLSKKPVPVNVGNPADNPEYWAITGQYNGQIAQLQNDIQNIENAIDGIDTYNKSVKGNLLLNHIFPHSDGSLNGSCYIGNGNVVAYFRQNGNNTGTLRCYNMNTYTIAWEYPITGYHGNTIAYNPNTNMLYICGCKDEVTSNLINKIVEISLSNPSVVVREIVLPTLSECISLAYDESTNKFYAISTVGSTPGVSDMMYTFNANLDALEASVQLKDYPTVAYPLTSVQAGVLSVNGVLYVIAYNYNNRYVVGYDVTSGDVKLTFTLPDFINKCRAIGELQSMLYDFDNDRYIMGSELYYCGLYQYKVGMWFEIDLYKGIVETCPEPSHFFMGTPDTDNNTFLYLVPGANTLKPMWLVHKSEFAVPSDAIYYCKINNLVAKIACYRSDAGIAAQTDVLWCLPLDGFSGQIQGFSNTDRVKIHELRMRTHSNVLFNWCEFTGYTAWATGNYANISIGLLSRVLFLLCTFADYTSDGTNYHLFIAQMSNVTCESCTFEGTMTQSETRDNSTVTVL